MNRRNRKHTDQLTLRHDAVCTVTEDADRISLSFDRIYPKALKRIGEEVENMGLCRWTLEEEGTLYLMQPDFGLFAGYDELLAIIQELCEEVNYNVTFK